MVGLGFVVLQFDKKNWKKLKGKGEGDKRGEDFLRFDTYLGGNELV
jgi:hypothetical protein